MLMIDYIIYYSDIYGRVLNSGSFNLGYGYLNLYYKNGNPYMSGMVNKGLKEGYWKLYSKQGKLVDSILYKNVDITILDKKNIIYFD